MTKIWRLVRKIEGLDSYLSLLTPLHNNPDFLPRMNDGLIHLRDKGIHVIGDLIENKQLMTFEQFTAKFELNKKFFLVYHQIRSFITKNLRVCSSGFCVSPIEEQLNKITSPRSVSKIFYNILIRANTDSSEKTRVLWEKDFGEEIQMTDWEAICEMPSYLTSNSAWEMQYKIVHRLHVTPVQRHKVNQKLSNLCNKCKILEGTLIHCFWSCSKIQQFWMGVVKELEKICHCSLEIGPKTCLLGMNQELPSRFQGTHLLQILLHCARKCILVCWITDQVPSIAQWINTIKGLIPYEAFSTALKDKPFKFHKVWDPFFTYLGAGERHLLALGIRNLAWKD